MSNVPAPRGDRDRKPVERRPVIEAMPHLSAPIDEHPLVPWPKRSWWDKVLLAALGLGAAAVALGVAFLRGSAFH